MKRGVAILLLAVLYVFIAAAVWSQEYIDVVYLKNGSVIRGIIIEQIPGVSIKISSRPSSRLTASRISRGVETTCMGKSMMSAYVRSCSTAAIR